MTRILGGTFLCAGLALGACTAAYADKSPSRPPPPPRDQALAIAPEAVRAAYNVDIEDESGNSLRMFAQRGRYYVLGGAGDRYVIHVTNPTAQRIEAVVTVDGLDVIDGENGDLHKRGYVVQPYGDLRVEGFRTSTTDVATFRFSAVGDSYAERKGKGRNVGVIAVAIFEEQPPPAPPQIIEPSPPPPPDYYDYRNDLSGADEKERPAPPTTTATAHGSGTGSTRAPQGAPASGAGAAKAPPPARTAERGAADKPADTGESWGGYDGDDIVGGTVAPAPRDPCCTETKRDRAGLGTEFGESRYSAVTYTKFVRSSAKPAAVAELRYNDAAGLTALGIPVEPTPDADEIGTRESANPFPGDEHFARPPAGVR